MLCTYVLSTALLCTAVRGAAPHQQANENWWPHTSQPSIHHHDPSLAQICASFCVPQVLMCVLCVAQLPQTFLGCFSAPFSAAGRVELFYVSPERARAGRLAA
jgi:hypothetical protein